MLLEINTSQICVNIQIYNHWMSGITVIDGLAKNYVTLQHLNVIKYGLVVLCRHMYK